MNVHAYIQSRTNEPTHTFAARQVTLGGSGRPCEGPRRHPVLGNGCVVGAGAKILGSLTIGDRVKVGGNSVVLSDVPSNTVAVGVPSRVVGRSRTTKNPNNVEGALIGTDLFGRIVKWNDLAVQMFGYSREEALGMDVGQLMPSPHREV